ncbi:MAG: XisI protein [Okeania sp. SIO3I5]|uniref:element excision factor XisI family protein n=1 Tax=Okeania sp. SIO3I5 TaxID=2607805 RepID=UPI0013BB7F6D|nr:element excision factor XisI family protein [Okeania sp. SIO3I5]NEQ40248.1 XisI protein [Okeania sp. SIO3I5]
METTNQLLDLKKWRETLMKMLQYHADTPYHYGDYGDVKKYPSVSTDGNHFLLVYKGWKNGRRVCGTIVHAEIRIDQIWIHYDHTENGMTEELIVAGVPKDRIVVPFYPLWRKLFNGNHKSTFRPIKMA